jgi:hypothetical protein
MRKHCSKTLRKYVGLMALLISIDLASILEAQELIVPAKVSPLRHGLAENDFVQERPLQTALELGFRAIDVDVFLTDNQLKVGYSILDLNSRGTFENLYLAPLKKLKDSNSQLIQNDGEPLLLFVVFKSDGRLCYKALRPLLEKYADILTSVRDEQQSLGAVSIIVGGDSPRDIIMFENPRYVAIDGRYSDIEKNEPPHLISTISLRWSSYYNWKGGIEFQPHERAKLTAMIEKVHKANRKIRFWSTPDSEQVWTVLQAAKVDWIGAEQYGTLHKFLTPAPSPFGTDESK